MRREARSTYVSVDSREPPDVREALSLVLGYEPERYALPEGDFLLVDPDGCMLLIERKTISDFLASLVDGRLRSQLTRMQATCDTQGLILEGSYTLDGEGFINESVGTRWSHASLQMTLWSIQTHCPGLVVFWTNHLGATVDVIRALANRGKTKGCFKKTNLLAVTPGEDAKKVPSGRKRAGRAVTPRRAGSNGSHQ
jgi:ERCC4-type nuclease